MSDSSTESSGSRVFGRWSPQAPTSSVTPTNSRAGLNWRAGAQGAAVAVILLWLTAYMALRIHYINQTPVLLVFSLLVCGAELHIILHLYGMLYGLWPRRYQKWETLNRDRNLRCNLFVCVCGEPPEVVRETIAAALTTARNYVDTIDPVHPPRVIVLNDGNVAGKDNWREIEAICRELGAEHIARQTPGGFKAGNINNGLRLTPSDDPHNTLDIVFDSDFCAKPEFLVEIVKPFADADIDFVQSPQRYKNETTWVAKAAAAHQIFFFDWICPAKGHDNALFLCGTNFAIRRRALNHIGGLDERFITEDYATSLELHLTGHRGVFMPKVLALGMAPTSLKQYFTQQRRWSKGNFDVTRAYFRDLMNGPLTWKQKMHYVLSATYYLIGIRDLILMLAPLPFLFFGESLLRPTSREFLLFVYAPLFLVNTLLYCRMFRFPVKSLILDLVSFPVFTGAFFGTLFNRQLGFVVTIKKYERESPLSVYKPQLVVAILLLAGLICSWTTRPFGGVGTVINYWWAAFNVVLLGLGFYLLVIENANWKTWEAAPAKLLGLRLGTPRVACLRFASMAVLLIIAAVPLVARLAPQRDGQSSIPFTPRPLLAAPVAMRGQILQDVKVHPREKVIALTFDDGPYPHYTEQVLEVLKTEKVRATFYMIGANVERYPAIARRVAAAGHDIGNHSWSHTKNPSHPEVEVWKTSKIIEQVLGVTPTHFRPPMGILDNGMAHHAKDQHKAILLWSCDTRDWSGSSSEDIVAGVLRDAKPGGIVLMHDGGGDRSNTIRALPTVIHRLREQGYRFVTIPELLHLDIEAA